MILRKLWIETFGGLESFECSFEHGLNILLGPNEAGKSTLFHVIDYLLFGGLKPRKNSPEERELAKWFPAGGGDTIRAGLNITFDEGIGEVEIVKQWGVNPEVKLTLPGGGTITEENEVRRRIDEAAGISPATVRQLFLLRQSLLKQTIGELSKDGGAVEDLHDVLQRSIMETDGVSVRGFLDRLDKMYRDYFGRWDRKRNYPEEGRGIEDPWKKGTGEIVTAWYDYRRLEGELTALKETDEKLQSARKEREQIQSALGKAGDFVSRHEQAVKRAERKRGLAAELSGLQGEIGRLKEDQKAWIAVTADIERLEGEKKELESRLKELEKERKEAEEANKNRRDIEKLARAGEAKKGYETLQKELEGLTAMPDEEYRELKKLCLEREKTAEQLKAGRLRGTVKAKQDLRISIAGGTGEPEGRDIFSGSTVEVDGDGRLRFLHDEWEIEVFSKDIDFTSIEGTRRRISKRLEAVAAKYGTSNPEEAEKRRNARALKEQEAAAAYKALEEILDGEDFESLNNRVGGGAVSSSLEDYSRVIERHTEAKAGAENVKSRLGEAVKRNEEFIRKYRDQDSLLEKLGELISRQSELSKQIEDSGEIPPQFKSPEEFIAFYERERKRFDDLTGKAHQAELRCIELESELPDISLEELEEQTEKARLRFEKVKNAGEVVDRVRTEANNLWEELQANPYTPFYDKVDSYLSLLSGKKYTQVGREDTVPGTVINPSGHSLAFSQLSSGTKDLFALAVRLAMAEFFLDQRAGFLLLDDPLVELDPERQKKAAELIRRFSESRQCLFFTCHPHAAALFPREKVIELTPGVPG